jgi:hypothetical protein
MNIERATIGQKIALYRAMGDPAGEMMGSLLGWLEEAEETCELVETQCGDWKKRALQAETRLAEVEAAHGSSIIDLADMRDERDAALLKCPLDLPNHLGCDCADWVMGLTHQECAAKKHPDYWLNTEHNLLCPWCKIEEMKAKVLPDPQGGCVCIPHSQDAGGGYTEHLLEYEPACPEHSGHLYDPRTGEWISDVRNH